MTILRLVLLLMFFIFQSRLLLYIPVVQIVHIVHIVHIVCSSLVLGHR